MDRLVSGCAAEAIMTTDTRAKQAVYRSAGGWTIGGMAKGAGMTELRTGAKVLIPGTIVEVVESGTVIVETAFGNTVVERSSDLELATSEIHDHVGESKEQRVERFARLMCEADSVDPEAKASIGQPIIMSGGFIMAGTQFEAWRLYAKYARALIHKGLA